MRQRTKTELLARLPSLGAIALCVVALAAAAVSPARAQGEGQERGGRPPALTLPSRMTERFGQGWTQEFRLRLHSAARADAISGLAIAITLETIRLDQLPDDPAEAALFCAKVAAVADVALRSGYSPTLLAADVRQVLRSGASPAFGPGLVGGPRWFRDRPIVRGPFTPPGPARPGVRGGQPGGSDFQSPGGFGQQ